MSDNDFLYVQDVRKQMRFLTSQCRSAAQAIGDPELRNEDEIQVLKNTNKLYTLL